MKSKYNKFFETGGNLDIFENYSNEHGILIDDFRVNVMDYNELLRMLNPYNTEVNVSSRYHSKEDKYHKLTNQSLKLSDFDSEKLYLSEQANFKYTKSREYEVSPAFYL